MSPLILDTCAVIWLGAAQPIARPAAEALERAATDGKTSFISPITAWELGVLVSRGRLPTATSERRLLERILAVPGVSYAEMPPDVLVDSSYLPGTPPADPADRIIIATARQYDLTVVTRDRKILNYAEDGHVRALAC